MSLKNKIYMMFVVLGVFTLLTWLSFFLLVKLNLVVFSVGVLAYCLGLTHAFDADHIAAIDNVTRKLRQDEKKAIGVGFTFSLGHSTVVLLLSLAIVISVKAVQSHMDFLKNMGGIVGTIVSAGFLTLIGILNIFVLRGLYNLKKAYEKGKIESPSIEMLFNKKNIIGRVFRFFYKKIDKTWKMYPIGFLFGLGFDTATEVAILAISAAFASHSNLPLWGIMIFPLLFTAGMCLMDSSDGLAMMKVYDWAMSDAIRKLFFNIFITGASVFIALFVGLIEWLQVISSELHINTPFFMFLQNLDFGKLGIVIVSILIMSWIGAFFYYKKALSKSYNYVK